MDYDKVFQEIESLKDGHWDFVNSLREMRKLILNEVLELTQDLDPDTKDSDWISYGSPDKQRLVLHLCYSESSVDLYATFSKYIAYASQADITYRLDFDSKGADIFRINNKQQHTDVCLKNKNIAQWLAEQVRYYWESPLEDYNNYEPDIIKLYDLEEEIRREYCELKVKWVESFAKELALLFEAFVDDYTAYRIKLTLPNGKLISIYDGGMANNCITIDFYPVVGNMPEFSLWYYFHDRNLLSKEQKSIPFHNRRLVDVVYEKLKEHF